MKRANRPHRGHLQKRTINAEIARVVESVSGSKAARRHERAFHGRINLIGCARESHRWANGNGFCADDSDGVGNHSRPRPHPLIVTRSVIVRSDTQTGPEKDGAGNAEENRSPTESTDAASNHVRLIESIQKYFGKTRKQTGEQAESPRE